MVSSITETTAPPTPPAHRGHSDSDRTPEVSSNEENSQESISTNKFDSENCFSDVSDDSGSKSASADDEDHLKAKNKHLEQKLAELEIKLQENKHVIQSLANKNDNLREESELNRANMTEWIDQLKEKIIHLEEENRQKNEQIEAYIAQNNYLNEEILELHGRRKCEATTAMTSSVRRCSEQSDISLVESFIEEADDFNETGDEFVLVDDQETPDSETCTWEECIASIKNRHTLNANMKNQIRQGIPARFRPRVWQAFLRNKLEMKIGLYHKLSNIRPDEDVVKQIALDLPRTSRWLVSENSVQFKERLRRVLWAFANYNKDVGYCQGLNRIACLALEHLSEEDSFHFLRLIVDHELPPDYYTKEMKGILADGKLISEILSEKCSKLHEHLKSLDVNNDISATNWLLVIFIDPSIDIEITLKIWDAFLCEGNKVLIRWVLAIYMYHEKRLMNAKDQGQVMQILRYYKVEQKEFDAIQNLAYNRLNPFSRRYIDGIRKSMLKKHEYNPWS